MVALVLDHTGMEARDRAVDRVAVEVAAGVTHPCVTRHDTTHPRHRQAALPALLLRIVERRNGRIAKDGVGHLVGVGVARIAAHAKDHHLQQHADLRRSDACAVERRHGVLQVVHQLAQLRRAKGADRRRDLQQPRVAHSQYWPHSHQRSSARCCTMRTTCCIAAAKAVCAASSETRSALSPIPAASLATTANMA